MVVNPINDGSVKEFNRTRLILLLWHIFCPSILSICVHVQSFSINEFDELRMKDENSIYLGWASVWQSIVTSVPDGAPTSWLGTESCCYPKLEENASFRHRRRRKHDKVTMRLYKVSLLIMLTPDHWWNCSS